MYPILDRMLAEGWLEDGWEDQAEVEGSRPRRRYYRLTEAGRDAIGGILAKAPADGRFKLIFDRAERATWAS
jgi:PadR family transcriptional regulator PadR